MTNMKFVNRLLGEENFHQRTVTRATGKALVWIFLLCIQLISPSSSTPVPAYDWCEATGLVSSGSSMDMLRDSLINLQSKDYDWRVILQHVEYAAQYMIETHRLSSTVQRHLVDTMNIDEEMIEKYANLYLAYAPSTPKAVRYTEENTVEQPTEDQMGGFIVGILSQHAETLASMVRRLQLVHETESVHSVKNSFVGYHGETVAVLCAMQYIFQDVAGTTSTLTHPKPLSDIGTEELDVITDGHMGRHHAAYGLTKRHSEILMSARADILHIRKLIRDNTSEH